MADHNSKVIPEQLQQRWARLVHQVQERLVHSGVSIQSLGLIGNTDVSETLKAMHPDLRFACVQPRKTYDAIVHLGNLHRITDWKTHFADCKQQLHPNGLLLCGFWGGNTLKELTHAYIHADLFMYKKAYQRVLPFVRLSDVVQAFQVWGFRSPLVDCERMAIAYTRILDFWSDLGFWEEPLLLDHPPITHRYVRTLESALKSNQKTFALSFEWFWLLTRPTL